jgi:hypothetical protein
MATAAILKIPRPECTSWDGYLKFYVRSHFTI